MFSLHRGSDPCPWFRAVRLVMLAACMAVSFVVLAGCGQRRIEINEDLPELPPISTRIGPGDELYIEFFNHAELTSEHVVRPDGKIMLQLIGEVTASGKSPGELAEEIEQRYEGVLHKPKVAINILEQPDQVVYVSGEVFTPREVPFRGRITILQAIMKAGGFDSKRADISRVMLIRHSAGKRYMKTYDMEALLQGKEEPGGPVFLEPGDIIYVPKLMSAK